MEGIRKGLIQELSKRWPEPGDRGGRLSRSPSGAHGQSPGRGLTTNLPELEEKNCEIEIMKRQSSRCTLTSFATMFERFPA